MGYELYIMSAAGAWVRLDLGDTVPAMVFQINTLAELTDRQASYSQAISLPFTPNNARAFGFANVEDVTAAFPYEVHPCALYCRGLEIISPAYRLELRTVDTAEREFICQIVSNVVGLVDILANTPFSETPIPAINWTYEDIRQRQDVPHHYLYMLASLRKPISSMELEALYQRAHQATHDRNGANAVFQPAHMQRSVTLINNYRPYLRVRDIVDMIFAQHGYSLVTDIDEAGGEDIFVSLTTLTPGPDSFDNLEKNIRTQVRTIATGAEVIYPFQYGTGTHINDFLYSEMVPSRAPWPGEERDEMTYGVQYTAPGNMSVIFNMRVDGTNITRMRFRARRMSCDIDFVPYMTGVPKDDWQIEFDELVDMEGTLLEWDSEPVQLSAGEILYVEVMIVARTGVPVVQTTVNVRIDRDGTPNVCAGGRIYPALSCDFETQADFVKMFLQAYGLTINIDPHEKIIYAYTFSEMQRRRAAAVDWSDRLDESGAEIGFRVGSYAQNNRVLMQENPNSHAPGGVYQDTGVIGIPNATLPGSNDLFTLPVESSAWGEDIPSFALGGWVLQSDPNIFASFRCAEIPTYELVEAVWYFETEKTPVVAGLGNVTNKSVGIVTEVTPKHHLVMPSTPLGFPDNYMIFGYVPDVIVGTDVLACPAIPVTAQYLINTYYPGLVAALNNVKTVKAKMKLNPQDISKLDLFTPVFLRQYGQAFYISRINNYRDGELTEIELIRI